MGHCGHQSTMDVDANPDDQLEAAVRYLRQHMFEQLRVRQTAVRQHNQALFTPPERSQLYSFVYLVCTAYADPLRACRRLHQLVQTEIDSYIEQVILSDEPPLPLEADRYDDEVEEEHKEGSNDVGYDIRMLHYFMRHFNAFRRNLREIACVFRYLNKRLIPMHKLKSIEHDARKVFTDRFYRKSEVHVISQLIEEIARVRNSFHGERRAEQCAASVVTALLDLDPEREGPYKRFEKLFLSSSRSHFLSLASEYAELSLHGFIDRVAAHQRFETKEILSSFHPSTRSAAFLCFHDAILANATTSIFDGRVCEWIDFFCSEDSRYMRGLYELYRNDNDALDRIGNKLQESFVHKGIKLMNEHRENGALPSRVNCSKPWAPVSNADAYFVHSLLDLSRDVLSFIQQCFDSTPELLSAYERACVTVLSKQLGNGERTTTQLLAHYCDVLLNVHHPLHSKVVSDRAAPDLEYRLTQVVSLVALSSDHELFMKEFAVDLAARLLTTRYDGGMETILIKKLKHKCGRRYTSKLEAMIHDVELSRDLSRQVSSTLACTDPRVRIQFLTRGIWPPLRTRTIHAPIELAQLASCIESIYADQFPRRLLAWQFGMGTAQIVTRWTPQPYTLHVTTAQACALLLFNSSSRLTFDELCQALRVEAAFGKRLMHSLSCGYFRVLLKEPVSQFVGLNDVFVVNDKFTCESSSHIRLPTTIELEAVEEPSKAQYIDHSATIQAAIVRVMKRERTLSHSQLVDTVSAELERFRVEPKKIRARIDHLVENEYLERGDNDMYHYIP